MTPIDEKFGFSSDPMSSSPPPSSPCASDTDDVFTPLKTPRPTAHSTQLASRPSQPRLFSGINESSNPANPTSAFYQHPTTRYSLQQAPPDFDLEAGLAPPPALTPPPQKEAEFTLSSYSSRTHLTTSSRNASVSELDITTKTSATDSAIWPSKQELEKNAREVKRQEARKKWNFIGAMDKRQRIAAQVLIALLVVAAAVGLGVGISRAVRGGVYGKGGPQSSIST